MPKEQLTNLNIMFNRKINLTLCLFAFCLCFLLTINLPSALASTAKHYTDLVFPPLPALQLPKYTRFQLKNGLIVYLMEDHELPLVSGTALIRTGGRWEPGEKVGLADITGDVMRMGGTLKHPPDELNKLLENRAASIETSIDLSSGSASFGCLTPDLDPVFNLFAEVLRSPAFPQDKLDLVKQQQKGSIARRNDSPNSIVGREFSKLIYGQESPYARTIEYTTLDNISRADMVALYQKYFHPENIILGISGDFDSAKMRSNIEAKLGDWAYLP
jgi:zinc protease